MDDDDNKKSKNKKKGAAAVGKGPMISGQGIGNAKEADIFKNQLKGKGVGKVAGSGGPQNFEAPSTSSKQTRATADDGKKKKTTQASKKVKN